MIRATMRLLAVALISVGVSFAQASCPSVPTASRFSFNAAGDEVTDSKTGLVWARCSVGQAWSGNDCTGSATAHTHEEALAMAQAATGWRLPNVRELSSIADKGCQSPAIDNTGFPSTPNNFNWSSSPYVGVANYAWGVYFQSGFVTYDGRGNARAVRLVRISH